jgi:ABC-type nitrate/sulfonate/bicarbonate transport system substrate-binding protein
LPGFVRQRPAGTAVGRRATPASTAIAAREILKGSGIDPSAVNFFYTQSTESSRTALTSKKIAAAMLPPPFAEETEVRGFNRLAEAKDFAPLSGIGLLASADSLKKNPAKGVAVIRAVLRTMGYMRDAKNHGELVDYILRNEEPRRKQRGIRRGRDGCPHGVADKPLPAP